MEDEEETFEGHVMKGGQLRDTIAGFESPSSEVLPIGSDFLLTAISRVYGTDIHQILPEQFNRGLYLISKALGPVELVDGASCRLTPVSSALVNRDSEILQERSRFGFWRRGRTDESEILASAYVSLVKEAAADAEQFGVGRRAKRESPPPWQQPTDKHQTEVPESVSQFNYRTVTLVRNAGTPTETRREIRMGGDFATKALFFPEDRVSTGEEIHCDELFDEPRVIVRVNPFLAHDGVCHWEAPIMPLSEWIRLGGPSQLRRFGDFNPPVLGALLPQKEFPKWMYHETLLPVQAFNADEEASARAHGYGDVYIHQDYPKCKYHWNGKTVTVKNSEEEAALGGGWANSPDVFDPYRDAKKARPQHPDPVRWVDEWSVPGLSPDHRTKIRAQLWKADAAFGQAPETLSADFDSMRAAFDGVAKVLFDARILTEQLLESDIPTLVWDSAIAAGWFRFASETRKGIFPDQIGHYWVWRDESRDWRGLFRAQTSEWRSKLLEDSAVPATVGSEAQPTATAISKTDSTQGARRAGKRGRRGNQERRDAIRRALMKYGEGWRDHLDDVFKQLDSENVPLGDFNQIEINLGEGQTSKVSKWDDLGLAEGDQRKQIIDALRKYADWRT
jgi:hypothetical protein